MRYGNSSEVDCMSEDEVGLKDLIKIYIISIKKDLFGLKKEKKEYI